MRGYRPKTIIGLFFSFLSLFIAPLYAQNLKISKAGMWRGDGSFRGVYVQGNYAYVADMEFYGLVIIDISDPQNPAKAGELRLGTDANDVFVAGRYAYLADGYSGLRVIDVSNPQAPVLAATCDTPGIAREVEVVGSTAYVADGGGGLQIIDVSNPAAPVIAGSFDPGQLVDGTYYSAAGLCLSGTYVYVAADGQGLDIIDVGNPTAPVRAGRFPTSSAQDVAVSGKYAVVANRYDVQIVDVSNPALPIFVSKPNITGYPYVERVVVKGNYAYIGNNMRLQVIDFSNPAAPQVFASTAFYAWDLFVSDNTLYGVWAPGLQILDLTSPAAPALIGSYITPGDGLAVCVNGTHAYYLDDQIGLTIVDVSNPAAPAGQGSFHTSRQAAAVYVAGGYAYVVDRDVWGDAGTLYVVGVSNPSTPTLIGSADIGNSGWGIVIAGRYAYVSHRAGPNASGSGLKIFDVLDPAHPVLIGGLACDASDIDVANGFAYLTGYHVNANALTVVNVVNPAAPALAGAYPLGSSAYARGISVQGGYAYCGVHQYNVSQTYFHVLDIANPAAPVLVGTSPRINTYAGSLRASGKYVYIANWDSGVAVFDVSNPAAPLKAGSYGGYGDPDYIVAGDIAVAGSYAYVVSESDRLYILNVAEGAWPVLTTSRTDLYFRAIQSRGLWTSSQTVLVSNTGYGTLQWTATADKSWITLNPASGTEDGFLSIGVDPTGLVTGSYSGIVTISDPNAIGSPKKITLYLDIDASGGGSPPFGFFDTPMDGTTGVTGAIPVSGWALDDVEAASVKIFRDPDPSDPAGAIGPNGLVYIGDAVFVEGARPDVEMSGNGRYKPFSYRAGWGYMMLTNMLPGQGNGVFKIYAYAYDLEGNATLLGTKTITCDNAHGVKPFGAIDTPAQGGGASGPSYANFGWVLAPQPNEIPKDGSTIAVWIDGVSIGRPVYDGYRKDVADAFPGLKNSNGPVGYYYFDTTKYAAGVQTIWWTAEDGAGNADGIGSRYFTIVNAGAAPLEHRREERSDLILGHCEPLGVAITHLDSIQDLPLSFTPLFIKHGINLAAPAIRLNPDPHGVYHVDIKEVEFIRIALDPDQPDPDNPPSPPNSIFIASDRRGRGDHTFGKGREEDRVIPPHPPLEKGGMVYAGYMLVGEELRPLPIGSTLDRVRGTFAWLPGPGFLGRYDLVFVRESASGLRTRIPVTVTVKPKY